MLDDAALLAAIRAEVERRGSIAAAAKAAAVSDIHLRRVLNGKRGAGALLRRRFLTPKMNGRSRKDVLTEDEMRRVYADAICDYGRNTILAKECGLCPQYISDVARGRRPVSDRIARALGYRKIVSVRFEKIEED